jgi:hypothetical protein
MICRVSSGVDIVVSKGSTEAEVVLLSHVGDDVVLAFHIARIGFS